MTCLIKLSEYSDRVYGKVAEGATPPTRQSLARKCRNNLIPAKYIDGRWYVDWDAHLRLTENKLVNRVLLNTRR